MDCVLLARHRLVAQQLWHYGLTVILTRLSAAGNGSLQVGIRQNREQSHLSALSHLQRPHASPSLHKTAAPFPYCPSACRTEF